MSELSLSASEASRAASAANAASRRPVCEAPDTLRSQPDRLSVAP
jgi:hypothetical protein